MPNHSQSISGGPLERQISYRNSNTCSTQNPLTATTRNVWTIFHGMGHLRRLFLSSFYGIPPQKHYFITPQAPSNYYLNNTNTQVGASWVTRENTLMETEYNLLYYDAVLQAEAPPANCNLIVFAYLQGVSIATRWMARRKISCHRSILYHSTVPAELTPSDFSYLRPEASIRFVLDDQDEFIHGTRREKERDKLVSIFNGKVEYLSFKGGHALNKELINLLI